MRVEIVICLFTSFQLLHILNHLLRVSGPIDARSRNHYVSTCVDHILEVIQFYAPVYLYLDMAQIMYFFN